MPERLNAPLPIVRLHPRRQPYRTKPPCPLSSRSPPACRAAVSRVTAGVMRSGRKPAMNLPSGRRRPRGRRNSPRRRLPLPLCFARQEQARGGAHTRQPYFLLIDRDFAPITSTIRGVPSKAASGDDDGIKAPCAVNLHNTITVFQDRLGKLVAKLSGLRINEICAALRFSLGCDQQRT